MWIAAPIAAAAVIVLAVMLWRGQPTTVAPETTCRVESSYRTATITASA
jgi:hypothetical protein